MMGKLNVKSGVGKFSNINDGSAQEIRVREGSGVGMEKGTRRRLSLLGPIR